jgi:hypothetical protein
MSANYVLLEKVTVGSSGASSVTFNNIPQTGYTDLVVKFSARDDISGQVNDNITVSFNGSSANGTSKELYGTGSAAGSGSLSNVKSNYITGAGATSSTFSNNEIYIPNYTSSNYKSVSSDGVAESNTAGAYMALEAGLWSQTAAIISITFTSGNSANFVANSTFYLYGISAVGTTPTVAPYAAGGDIIQTDGTYWYHAFLSSGTFTPAKSLSCDVLQVAGGGGAGGLGGGGGAGGLLGSNAQSFASSIAYAVTIGAGGAGGISQAKGTQGADSSIIGGAISLTATGGGYGAGQTANFSGGAGGSGGGSVKGNAGGTATSGQGNNGGIGYTDNSQYNYGGGGGGAGAVGGNSSQSTGGHSGNGGNGSSAYSSWGAITNTGQNVSGTYYYAGGGIGWWYSNAGNYAGTPGYGGGGAASSAGTVNTGGGGSSSTDTITVNGFAGGSGITIIRYLA